MDDYVDETMLDLDRFAIGRVILAGRAQIEHRTVTVHVQPIDAFLVRLQAVGDLFLDDHELGAAR